MGIRYLPKAANKPGDMRYRSKDGTYENSL